MLGFLKKGAKGVANGAKGAVKLPGKAVGAAKWAATKLAIKLAIHEVATDEEYGPVYAKVKAFLNGKKTAIGLVLLYAPDIIHKAQEVVAASGYAASAGKLGVALAIVGGLHKLVKYAIEFGVINDKDGNLLTEE